MRVTSTGETPSPAASEVVEVQWWYEGLPPEEQPSAAMQWTKNVAVNVVAGLLSAEYTPDGSWILISRADGQVLWNTMADDATEWPSEYPVKEVRETLAESSWSEFAQRYGLTP